MKVNIRVKKDNIEKFIDDIGNININIGNRQVVFKKDYKKINTYYDRNYGKYIIIYNVTLINKNKNIVIKDMKLEIDSMNNLKLLPKVEYKNGEWKAIKQHKLLKPYWNQLENLILNSFLKFINKNKNATIKTIDNIEYVVYSKNKYAARTKELDVIEL